MAEQIMAEEAEDADEAEEAEVAEDPSLPFGTTRPIYEAFLAMDVDRSTTVSASEMEAFLTDNMPEHVKGVHMMIRAFDRNGDVKLNLYEFGDMIKAKEEGDIMARYMWRVVDLNGSNCMLKNEYHTLLMRLGMGPDVSQKYTDEDFAKYDVELGDNDGHIRYKEFKALMSAPKDEEKKRNWFRALDKDGDGEITMAEQIMAWDNLDAPEMADIEVIHPETLKWDANKDGKLTFDEFKQQP